mmetsp:Transcript_19797/g.49450  ORF Transcript_19797/g.49450 Transcript_19797/m.49450 type:complete len:173 (-) Transcript_19797:38-556(-)
MMQRLMDLGDQTVLAVAARAASSLWRGLMLPLPCAWNWQLSLVWYAHAKWILPQKFNFKALALRINTHDSSCHEPPKLLYFNTDSWRRARLYLELRSRGPSALVRNAAMLRTVLNSRYFDMMGDCRAAASTLLSVMERACNPTFLLQRHSDFVTQLWNVWSDQSGSSLGLYR